MSQTHMRPDRGSPPSTPRWVKVFGIIIFILVVLFVIMHFTGSGFGGPGMHTPHGGAGDKPPMTLVTHRPVTLVGHTLPIEHGVQLRQAFALQQPETVGHTPPIEHGVQRP